MRVAVLLDQQERNVGKLKLAQTTAELCAICPSNRLTISDFNSGYRFLVDTGANISVLAKQAQTTKSASDFKLFAANGTVIETYGERTMTLNLGLRRSFTWTFVIADVKMSILGADFLEHFRLLVDIHGKKLVDKVTELTTPAALLKANNFPVVRTIDASLPSPVRLLLNKYESITRPASMKNPPKHQVQHHIITKGYPVSARARPLPPDKYRMAKKEFQDMMEMGICRPSSSPWASPLHMVKKKNGEWRPCGDYRALNNVTIPDRYPLPRLLDFSYVASGKNFFSKIDVKKAYHCITTAEPEKTAIITPFGLFEFPRMPFGLRNAGQTFQRFMDSIFRDLEYIFVFIDDILIASESETEHLKHLETVFTRLCDNGITINSDKCEFARQELDFLGYHITSQGMKPTMEKTQAISEYPKPKTVKELRRFLGMINFYRGSIPKAALHQAPLNVFLKNSKKNDSTPITWNPVADHAFELCKQDLRGVTTLAFPRSDAPIALMTDASLKCVGAVLQQKVKNIWKPIAFFSKTLSDAQIKYSTYDRELLGIYMAVKHFRRLIEGRVFTIFTDHKPLIHAFDKKPSVDDSPRRIRYLDYISQFSTDVQHISGIDNIVADALSRVVETISCPSVIDFAELRKYQDGDVELRQLMLNKSLKIVPVQVSNSNVKVFCDKSTGNARPYLPAQFRMPIFDSYHNLSHPGKNTTRKMISKNFIWTNMNKDINKWCESCLDCQRSKVHRHTVSPLGKFMPAARFSHVHIDIVGPLPTSQNKRYLITMIDRCTSWPEAFPVADITAETVARIFYEGWIVRFGCPEHITSDQGRQFESEIFRSLAKFLGVDKIRCTPYHPQANSKVERLHRTLKAALMARANTTHWTQDIPTVLFGLRSSFRQDTGYCAAELVYGTPLKLPADFFCYEPNVSYADFVQNLRSKIRQIASVPPRESSVRNIFVHPRLKDCSHVFVRCDRLRPSLTPPYEGPFLVVTRSDKVFTIKQGDKESNVSIDRLKPAFLLSKEKDSLTSESNSTPDKNPHFVTRSGRVSRPTVRFQL